MLVIYLVMGMDKSKSHPSFTTQKDIDKLIELNKSRVEQRPNEGDYHRLIEEMDEQRRVEWYESRLVEIEKEVERRKVEAEKKRLAELKKLEQEKKRKKEKERKKKEEESKWITKTMVVTAYTDGYESTQKTPDHPDYGVTASGKQTQRYTTLACPPSMKFGTKVYIPKMNNTYVCHDRGSAIVEGRLDIYMKDLSKARDFGKQTMEVKIQK